MKYSRVSKIVNLIDVVNFFKHLIYEKNLFFHPDDDFNDFVQNKNCVPSINSDEAGIYNHLMEQCFAVCEEQGIEIYSIGLASMRRHIKHDIQDPIEVGLLARRIGQDHIYKIVDKEKGGYVLSSLSDDIFEFVKETDIVTI